MGCYDFQSVRDWSGAHSLRWDKYRGRDVLPMWVADMDFSAPPAVLQALRDRIDVGAFPYSVAPDELAEVVADMLQRRFEWRIDPSWLVWLPSLVPALNLVCRAFTEPGDAVATFVPIYPPFLSAPRLAERDLVELPLRRRPDGRLTFDLDAFDARVTGRTRVLLLCSPHNPVGRVWQRDELTALIERCAARDIVVCSDEIHCDLVLDDVDHLPTAALGPEVAARTITLMAASKTYNVAGLNCGFAIISEPEIRRRFVRAARGILPHVNSLGYVATLAAYRHGEPWRQELLQTLRGNRDLVEQFVARELPMLSVEHPEATFLAWIDCRVLGRRELGDFFETHGIGLSDGAAFGAAHCVRLNFGCPRASVQRGLERIRQAVISA